MASWLPLAATAVLLVPAALVFAPAFAPRADDGVGPPFYEPSGLGVFPTEGSLGTHGCARPVAIAEVLAGAVPEGTEVCLETAEVSWAEEGRGGGFLLRSPSGDELPARVSVRWWQHGTPAVGMVVVAEGEVEREDGQWVLDPVGRWVDLEHPGLAVEAWHVSAGLIPENTYVWVNRTTVSAVWRNNDGPGGIGDDHVETGTLCPLAHLTTETTPPYFGIVTAPPIGATITLYGAVRWDDGHGWWEVHPIRAWAPLHSLDAAEGCPEDAGESGLPPPGFTNLVGALPIPPRGGT